MSAWGRVFALVYDAYFLPMERGGLGEMRRRLLMTTSGNTVEIGAGTGLNLAHYPRDGVTLTLTEPEPPMARLLKRKLAGTWPEARVIQAPADSLPLESKSVDTLVSTLVLCTVPDQGRALEEVVRVLKPGGRLLFLEHVRSDLPSLSRWQDRLHRPWRAFAYGCNCNLRTLDAIRASGLVVDDMETTDIPRALPIMRPVIVGSATAP